MDVQMDGWMDGRSLHPHHLTLPHLNAPVLSFSIRGLILPVFWLRFFAGAA